MRKFIGAICVLLGVLCLLSSGGFVIHNWWEAENAAKATDSLLRDIQDVMTEQSVEQGVDQSTEQSTGQNVVGANISTIKVSGYECIGILSIPALELQLPVLKDWSYEKLKKAPCHYYGSYLEKDFVIAAHNYKGHFGRLSELQMGDIVVFTDVNGTKYYYEVVLLETLPPTATKEMITSGFNLSLYTCTTGGGSRVTVRCNSVFGIEKQEFKS